MRTKLIAISLAAALVAAGSLLAGGCSTGSAVSTTPTTAVATEKSGAQLWNDNCKRCHNLRGPETYSAAQWEVAVHHMRLRANLTGGETRKVTEFLKSAS